MTTLSCKVAHHFQFEFFPTEDGFFDQNLVHRTQIQTALHDLFVLFAVESDAAAGAAERE